MGPRLRESHLVPLLLIRLYCTYIFQAADFSYLVLTNRTTEEGFRSMHGTFKIPGNGSYAIENCGRDCHVFLRVVEGEGDNATHGDIVKHPSYDNSGLILDDTKLPPKVQFCQVPKWL